MWGALLRRCLLSVPHAVCRFMERYDGQTAVPWAAVRRELTAMGHLTLLMVRDMGAPLSPTLFATDAQGSNEHDYGGYGIVGAVVPPRTAALAFELGSAPGYTVARLDGSIDGLLRPGRELRRRTPFSRFPASLLGHDETDWRPLAWGRWHWEDPVLLGEGRATVHLQEALAKCPGAHRHVVLSLQE